MYHGRDLDLARSLQPKYLGHWFKICQTRAVHGHQCNLQLGLLQECLDGHKNQSAFVVVRHIRSCTSGQISSSGVTSPPLLPKTLTPKYPLRPPDLCGPAVRHMAVSMSFLLSRVATKPASWRRSWELQVPTTGPPARVPRPPIREAWAHAQCLMCLVAPYSRPLYSAQPPWKYAVRYS